MIKTAISPFDVFLFSAVLGNPAHLQSPRKHGNGPLKGWKHQAEKHHLFQVMVIHQQPLDYLFFSSIIFIARVPVDFFKMINGSNLLVNEGGSKFFKSIY